MKKSNHKSEIPTAEMAIKAIEEKKKIKLPQSQEDYERFSREMDAIDIKYGFIKL